MSRLVLAGSRFSLRCSREGRTEDVARLVTEFATARLYLDLFRNGLTGVGAVLLLIALSRPVD